MQFVVCYVCCLCYSGLCAHCPRARTCHSLFNCRDLGSVYTSTYIDYLCITIIVTVLIVESRLTFLYLLQQYFSIARPSFTYNNIVDKTMVLISSPVGLRQSLMINVKFGLYNNIIVIIYKFPFFENRWSIALNSKL